MPPIHCWPSEKWRQCSIRDLHNSYFRVVRVCWKGKGSWSIHRISCSFESSSAL